MGIRAVGTNVRVLAVTAEIERILPPRLLAKVNVSVANERGNLTVVRIRRILLTDDGGGVGSPGAAT